VRIGRPFRLAAYKTTQEQFKQVLGRTPSWFSATSVGKDQVKGLDTARFPVEMVTWLDAVEFCIMLSQKENLQPCYRLTELKRYSDGSIQEAHVEFLKDGAGYRLPTEAEWEYCARAGKTTRYSFGKDAAALGDYAWFARNSGDRTHSVEEENKPNPWGLYDMGGHLWEWCEDVYHDTYAGAPADGSAWLEGGDQSQRVLRGASWAHAALFCRCASRIGSAPGKRYNNWGFRVAVGSPRTLLLPD
jgi:formylglycine-generating enzyme required for sulfatase activity